MTDPLIYNEIKKVFSDINSAVDAQYIDERNAEEIISHLTKDGGGIEVYGDNFTPQHELVDNIQERAKGTYKYAYGMDGSTTKDLTYNNGLILSASVAGVSVTGKDTVSDINSRSNVCVSAYFDDYNLGIDKSYQEENTRVNVNQFSRVNHINSKLPDWVSSISRSYAEGKQFEWLSEDISQPLFVDGPLLPADILIWILYHQKRDTNRSPMEDWPEKIQEIMQFYINGIGNCIMSKTPIFGVQKTTTATRVIDAISEKSPELKREDIPWTNDLTLFSDALKQDEKEGAIISYTPWYVERNVQLGGYGNVVPLKNYDGVNLKHGSAEEYVRAFFYVKPPNKKTVYRIGVPEMLFDRGWDRDTLRDIALAEMVKQFSEPLPIVMADEKVRISRNIRSQLRTLIYEEAQLNHNKGRGYDD